MLDLATSAGSRKGHKRAVPPPEVAKRDDRKWCGENARLKRLCNDALVTNWLVPESVWRSESKLIAAVVEELELLVRNRHGFDQELRQGDVVLLSPLPAFVERRPKRKGKKNRPLSADEALAELERAAQSPYPGRRLDLMGAFVRVLGTALSQTSFKSGELLTATEDKAKRIPMSVRELADLAGVAVRTCNDVLSILRRARWIVFTKHCTKESARGGVYSTQASVRRFDWRAIVGAFKRPLWLKFGFDKRREEKQEKQAERKTPAPSQNMAELAKRAIAAALKANKRVAEPPADASTLDRMWNALTRNERDVHLRAAGEELGEHASWADVVDAAKRRLDPPAPGPSEPETSDEP